MLVMVVIVYTRFAIICRLVLRIVFAPYTIIVVELSHGECVHFGILGSWRVYYFATELIKDFLDGVATADGEGCVKYFFDGVCPVCLVGYHRLNMLEELLFGEQVGRQLVFKHIVCEIQYDFT